MLDIPRTLALPAALVAVLTLAACGSSPSPGAASPQTSGTSGTPSPVGPPATGPSNPADVDFAMSMVTSHRQAGAIADLAPQHAKDDKIKALALRVEKAQGPEITTMAGWLVGGGIPVPDATGGHDMSGMGGTKMHIVISPQEITALGQATAAGFDRMWLQLMLKSHQGAVATARTELTKGSSPDAKQIARSIIDRQSPEIATMTSILTGLPQS